MLSDDVVKQAVEVFEDSFDKLETADQIRKNVSQDIKAFAENSEIEPKNLSAVFKQYVQWRKGKLKWGDDSQDDDFTSLLIPIMDEATAK